jgi:signal peptidase I
MRDIFLFLKEIGKIVLISLMIVLPIRYFLFQPFLVRGESMEPNFQDGDYLIVDEISYRLGDPKRGEVIVFDSPTFSSQRFIKRIVGLPGETVIIEKGIIEISNGQEVVYLDESEYLLSGDTSGEISISLGENEYFVLGDNRNSSYDSRKWGPLEKDGIIGKVFLRCWPFASFAKIEQPGY